MKFWGNILDPTKNRKVKGLVLATTLLVLQYIDQNAWVMAFMIFVGGNAYDKYLAKK